jgi:hypothetical protein
MGDLRWTKAFNDSSQNQVSKSVIQTMDGGFAITGYIITQEGGGKKRPLSSQCVCGQLGTRAGAWPAAHEATKKAAEP